MTQRELQRILLVEDDVDIQAVARMSLESLCRFEVRVASSGAEALEAAAEFRPDLILLDVMMPEMDGPSTLSALRRLPEATETPVIFMTAKVQDHEVAEYLRLGALGVIAKPFDPMSLCTRLEESWRQFQLQRAKTEVP